MSNGGINDVLRLIKRAKQPIPYQFCKNNVAAGDEGRRHVRGLQEPPEGGGLCMEQLDVTTTPST